MNPSVDDAEAQHHIESCPECGAWLETQGILRAELRNLAEAMGGPPPALEITLRAKFRNAARKPPRPVWVWAAAAALVLGICVGAWFAQHRSAPPIAGGPAPAAVGQGEFLLLDYGRPTPALTAGRLVRVTLPPTAPAWFGLPVDPSASKGIEADVLLGEDGVAQAVRLVNTSGK
jgi:hypothetical protein